MLMCHNCQLFSSSSSSSSISFILLGHVDALYSLVSRYEKLKPYIAVFFCLFSLFVTIGRNGGGGLYNDECAQKSPKTFLFELCRRTQLPSITFGLVKRTVIWPVAISLAERNCFFLYRRSKTDFFFKSCQKVVKKVVKKLTKVAKKLPKVAKKSCQKNGKIEKV
jgi:hypothetical protein